MRLSLLSLMTGVAVVGTGLLSMNMLFKKTVPPSHRHSVGIPEGHDKHTLEEVTASQVKALRARVQELEEQLVEKGAKIMERGIRSNTKQEDLPYASSPPDEAPMFNPETDMHVTCVQHHFLLSLRCNAPYDGFV